MPLSRDEKRSAAREALKEFIGRGPELEQVDLNRMSAKVNELLDDWKDKHGIVLTHQGRPVNYITISRDEMNYHRVKVELHEDDPE
jgi:hypothetical protein